MPNLLENFGIEFLAENDDTMANFVGYLVQNAKVCNSYNGAPYLFTPTGAAEFWLRTQKGDDGGFEIVGIDSHCCSLNCWKMICSSIELSEDYDDPMSRLVVFNGADDGAGMLPIIVINYDVLPSLMEGDLVEMQVAALPFGIKYYANEEEYVAAQPSDENGKKWMIADGSLFPVSFMYNHNPDCPEAEKDYSTDSHIAFTATVKGLKKGVFQIGDHADTPFIRCVVDTHFGELEFIHTLDQVPEEMRENIRVGSIVSGTCILSADVALHEYENGIVKDHEHNLRALRYTIVKGKAERLLSILADDAVYHTETSGNTYTGAQTIVDRINYVNENHNGKYLAHMATIADDSDPDLEYPAGTRCVVLAETEEDNYESIAFIKCDAEGMITNLDICTDGRYRFKIDKKPVFKSPLDDMKMPESVIEPVFLRAKFHNLLDDSVSEEDVAADVSDRELFDTNATNMINALQEHPELDYDNALESIFGYLFAKSIEREKNLAAGTECNVEYSCFDAFEGKLDSALDGDALRELRKKLELGKQFYKDYMNFAELKGLGEQEKADELKTALVTVQRIGQLHVNPQKKAEAEDMDDEPIPSDEEIESHIHELLASDPEDFDDIEEYIDSVEEYYGDNLEEFTFREAVSAGAKNYVKSHADDFDLNDCDGYSSYLYETDDQDMKDILMNCGAFRSWDDYDECRFAAETVNNQILAFDPDFQKEVFDAYLKQTQLTRDKVIQMLTEDYDMDEDDDLPDDFDRDIEDDFDAMGIILEDGVIAFKDMTNEQDYGTQDLLEELGWECEFEGDSWKLETIGVYFIE